MTLTGFAAAWFLPFVLPICAYVAYTDLARMKITNAAVLTLAGVFVALGWLVLPSLDIYLWRLTQLALMLGFGIFLNAAGVMGAGDAKFIAAASPYVALGDLRLIIALLAACLLGAVLTHKLARHTPLHRLAPHWQSWQEGKKFPMGFALGMTLALYLILGVLNGA